MGSGDDKTVTIVFFEWNWGGKEEGEVGEDVDVDVNVGEGGAGVVGETADGEKESVGSHTGVSPKRLQSPPAKGYKSAKEKAAEAAKEEVDIFE